MDLLFQKSESQVLVEQNAKFCQSVLLTIDKRSLRDGQTCCKYIVFFFVEK
jgi:hypothetical protein